MNIGIEHLPQTLYSADQVRELDRIAIEEYGIPGFELMSKAARFAFHAMLKTWPDTTRLIVFCGAGNNAGDGYVVASLAADHGINVQCVALSPPEKLRGDALTAYQQSVKSGVETHAYNSEATSQLTEIISLQPNGRIVIVDALLGTGLDRDVSGSYRSAIEFIYHARTKLKTKVLAIDIPSGLNANTGQPHGIAVEADLTTTFIGNKVGLMTGKGRHFCGVIAFDSLDIPDEITLKVSTECVAPRIQDQLAHLNKRPASAHKGTNGRVVLIGGNYGYAGAILIASQSCIRMGAGLTSVITRQEHCSSVVLNQPEVMAHASNSEHAKDLLANANVIGIGPGLGQDDWATTLLEQTLQQKAFKVLDADALNILANTDRLKTLTNENVLLTPHPGEAARLLNCSVAEVEHDRLSALRKLQSIYKCHVLLKGSGTLVASPELPIALCRYGNAGMANGGMGDALTGMLCGLIVQTVFTPLSYTSNTHHEDISYAIELTTNLHAKAADIQAQKFGQRGLLASDLYESVRDLLATPEKE